MQKSVATDGPPRGTGLASKSAISENAKIFASQVLTLTMDSNKSLGSKSKDEEKLLSEESEGESHNGTQLRLVWRPCSNWCVHQGQCGLHLC